MLTSLRTVGAFLEEEMFELSTKKQKEMSQKKRGKKGFLVKKNHIIKRLQEIRLLIQ